MFGGVEVLINLLDTVVGEFSHKDTNGKATCVNLSTLFPKRSPFSFSRSFQLLVSSQDSRGCGNPRAKLNPSETDDGVRPLMW